MTILINILLIILLILQIVVLTHMLIANIKREKTDKEFWQEMNKSLKKQVDKYNELYPEKSLEFNKEDDHEQNH